MFGNFSFWEIPILLVYVAFALALLVGVPVLVVRALLRSRRDPRAELLEVEMRRDLLDLETRVARLELEGRR